MRLSPIIAVAAAGTLSCAPFNICGQQTQTLAGERCVTSEDCPRPSAEVGVCLQDVGNERECVHCGPAVEGEAPSQCFLITPVSCS